MESRPRHALLVLALLGLGLSSAALADDRLLVHVLAADTHTTLGVQGGVEAFREARDRTSGRPVAAPADPMAAPDRVVWLIGRGRKTRLRVQAGRLRERRTWDTATGRDLGALHLSVPALYGGDPPDERASAPPAAAGEGGLFDFSGSPGAAPPGDVAPGEAYVGEAQSAEDLFGSDLGGLLEGEREKPRPVSFHGYVETLLMFGEDGPSAHVLDTGLMGNRGLEAKEGVLHLDASLGSDVSYFSQIRFIRFNNVDMRVNMLRIGDPAGTHWTIGRTISPFGTFPVRNLSDQNPLYGYPLGYFYRTGLRADMTPTLPALLAGRGLGGGGKGMALAGPGLYQTYILYNPPVGRKGRLSIGLQNGAQSNNENVTQNDRFGWVGRYSVAPHPSWTLGVSGSVAPYMTSGATGLAAGEVPEDFDQELIGFDLEFSRDRWRVLAEALWNDWDVSRNLGVGGQLGAFSWYLEAKYSITPRFFMAMRYSDQSFDDVPNGAGTSTSWDFDTDRIEVGVGYRPTVNVLAKLSGQHNQTDVPAGTPEPDDDVVVLQVIGVF